MKLVIVESPAKAKTIGLYLGADYRVLASFGHVRDLSPKAGSVKPEEDFKMVWEEAVRGKKILSELAKEAAKAEEILLATDPDREGEAISWHIYDILRAKKGLKSKPFRRVVFHEITKTAIQKAVADPRHLDDHLVESYLARRALDYLVGYMISPVLWRKLPSSRSAGRVQSVALRMICEREEEIFRFKPEEYWSLTGTFNSERQFEGYLWELEGKTLKKMDIKTSEKAHEIVEKVKGKTFSVRSVEKKEVKRYPSPPFTTSTLQQEASSKMRYGARQTMSLAQALYEQGFITYMRTDAVSISAEAIASVRKAIPKLFGPEYLPPKAVLYKNKQKNAQEAHEAIRAVDVLKTKAEVLKQIKDPKAADLYELIWKRTLASQMMPARQENTTVVLENKESSSAFRASGFVPIFDGFLRLYQYKAADGEEESEKEDKPEGRPLPPLKEGQNCLLEKILPTQHFTAPPPRFGEASLVKELELRGIGRPSTYASIISVLQDRSYVRLEKRRFYPENKGILVTAFLKSFFGSYVAYDYTAEMEDLLDQVASGKKSWKEMLGQFWTSFKVCADEAMKQEFEHVRQTLQEALGHIFFPDGNQQCPACQKGALTLQIGRYGPYLSCSTYPSCSYRKQLQMDNTQDAGEISFSDPMTLGKHPKTGEEISLRAGPFGPYCQMGESTDKKVKPKRASIPKGTKADEVTLELAVSLLDLPRQLGVDAQGGKNVETNYGRFGPYIKVGSQYVSLPGPKTPLNVTLEEALTLFREKGKKAAGRELGSHPDDQLPVMVKTGFYGPYVQHGKLNASIPKSLDSDEITLEEALTLLEKKAAKGVAPKKTTKTAPKKTTKTVAKATTKKKKTASKSAKNK